MRLLLLIGVAGCTDPVVALQLELPTSATAFDTSCVATVEMRVEGMTFPDDPMDYKTISVPLTTSASGYAEVVSAIRGKFEVPIPASGLKAVSLEGWNNGPGWDDLTRDVQGSDLVFFGRGVYSGDDTLSIPLTPNISCTRQSLTIHALDLVAFVTHAYSCSAATAPDASDDDSWVGAGTMTPALYAPDTLFFGDHDGADFMSNVATFMAPTQAGPESCLAFDGGDATAWSSGCASSGKGVCGTTTTDFELPIIAPPYDANSVDTAITPRFPGATFGGVFTSARQPLQGVRIDIDPALGQVVYGNLDTGMQKLAPTGGSTTSASGLFVIYTTGVVDVTFTSGTTVKVVKVGAPSSDGVGGLTVVF